MTHTQIVAHKTQRIGPVPSVGHDDSFSRRLCCGTKYKVPSVPTPPAYKDIGRVESSAAQRPESSRELVGDFPGSTIERFGATDQGLEPEPEGSDCAIPASPSCTPLRSY
jgi:hypothetical protein